MNSLQSTLSTVECVLLIRFFYHIFQRNRTWPEVNNTVVGGYQLVGAGKEFVAYHMEKKIVKTCQVSICLGQNFFC